jgi:hypothetical protein
MHQPVYCIDQGRPLADEPLTHPVQRLEILLVDVLAGAMRMVGHITASAMASASRLSCLFDFTSGLTNWGAMSLT